jgi:hypothetical protein
MHELAEQAGIELPGVLGQVRAAGGTPAAIVTEPKPGAEDAKA